MLHAVPAGAEIKKPATLKTPGFRRSGANSGELAGEGGFEPTVRVYRTPDFESGTFDHSATFSGLQNCFCKAVVRQRESIPEILAGLTAAPVPATLARPSCSAEKSPSSPARPRYRPGHRRCLRAERRGHRAQRFRRRRADRAAARRSGQAVWRVKVLYDAAADLSRGEAVRKLVDGAVKSLGRIDILVNNAGIQHMAIDGGLSGREAGTPSSRINLTGGLPRHGGLRHSRP